MLVVRAHAGSYGSDVGSYLQMFVVRAGAVICGSDVGS